MTALLLAAALTASAFDGASHPSYQRTGSPSPVSGTDIGEPGTVAALPDGRKAKRGPRGASETTAYHGPRRAAYSADVRDARHWAREHTTARGFRCLHVLWDREGGWRVHARGPMTRWGRAYGIPQALPGRKMRASGRDWRTSALTQVRWGLSRYIRGRYGSTCRALAFQRRTGYY